MATGLDESVPPRRRPVLGTLSLIGFTLSFFPGVWFYAAAIRQPDPFMAVGQWALALLIGCGGGLICWILSALGMARRESPRWPAYLGFIVCFGPAMLGLYTMGRYITRAIGL